MRILTLYEPWATLMALGEKRIETRGRATKYRGPLAIHAAKGGLRLWQLHSLYKEEYFKEALKDVLLHPGHIVAVVNLKACKSTEFLTRTLLIEWRIDNKEQAFGNYSAGRLGWVTDNVFRLPNPIPYKGGQGLGIVPPEVVYQIRAQGWKP